MEEKLKPKVLNDFNDITKYSKNFKPSRINQCNKKMKKCYFLEKIFENSKRNGCCLKAVHLTQQQLKLNGSFV